MIHPRRSALPGQPWERLGRTWEIAGSETPADSGKARRLGPTERRRTAKGLLRPTGPLFWSLVMYRLQGKRMELFEVVPADGPGPSGSGGQGPVTSRG